MTDPSQKSPGLLKRLSNGVDKGLSDFFGFEGTLIGRYPWYTIIICLLVTGLCAIGFVNFEQELDGEKLWTPSDQPSFDDKEYVESLYPDADVQVKVICVAKEGTGPNILEKPPLQELMMVWDRVNTLETEYKGKQYSFQTKCGRAAEGRPCKVESILDVWNYTASELDVSEDVVSDVNGDNTDAYGRPLNLNYVMGGLTRNNTGFIEAAQVFQIIMYLTNVQEEIDGENYDPINRAWTYDVIDLVIDEISYNYLDCYVSSIEAIDKVSNDAINSDIALLTIGYVLIIIYTLVVLFRNSPVYCKSQIAIFSIIAIGMAIASSFGLASAFGVKFNLVVTTLPFLLLGLGVDDSFVIVGAYFKEATKQDLTVPERISATMRSAGTSITVTSVTDLAAFAIGTWTDLPALRDFSIYATLGILFTYLYQAIFFTAILALDSRREERAKKGAKFIGFGRLPDSSNSMEMSQQQQPPKQADEESGTYATPQQAPSNGKFESRKCCGAGEFDVSQPTIITKIIGEYLPMFTLSTIGKIVIILLEIGLLTWGIIGATRVYMDFRFRDWFVPDGSWLKDSFKVEDRFFNGDSSPFYIYTKKGDYYENQIELENLVYAFGNDSYVTRNPPIDSWYIQFNTWLKEQNTTLQTSTQFINQLNRFLQSEGVFYSEDIIIQNDEILSTRMRAFTVDIIDGSYAIDALDSYRETADEAAPSFSAFPYGEQFLFWDGFRVIASQTVRNVIIAGVAVFIITLVLLANVLASLLVLTMVVLTDVCLFGFMWYVDLTFNTVTAINMVLAVGLAVDYSAHIAHSFLVVQGTRTERAQLALKDIGGEVFSGGFTTFLGVVIMGAASHYIFQTFFKMFFALIVLGLWHGVVFLPIVLSLVGPQAYDNA